MKSWAHMLLIVVRCLLNVEENCIHFDIIVCQSIGVVITVCCKLQIFVVVLIHSILVEIISKTCSRLMFTVLSSNHGYNYQIFDCNVICEVFL